MTLEQMTENGCRVPQTNSGKNIILSGCDSPALLRMSMRRRRQDFSDAFAMALEKFGIKKNLSRQSLAERGGLHQTYIGLIERGLSNPSLDAANAIAEALETPLSKLISEAEKIRDKAEASKV